MNEAWIYEANADNSARFILGKRGENPIVCIGVNPSTAEPGKLDNTIHCVESRAQRNGYDSWIMINLYPQRETNPDNLHIRCDPQLHAENLEVINRHIRPYPYDIWAAWGSLVEKRKYLLRLFADIYMYLNPRSSLYSVGKKSKNGHPHHPLYLKKDLPFERFDLTSYMLKEKNQ